MSLYPGLPTTAELFILPDEQTSNEHKKRSEEALETVRVMTCRSVHNQGFHFNGNKRNFAAKMTAAA